MLDNLSGHKTPSLVLWLVAHGWNADPTPFDWGGKRQLRASTAVSATATPSAAPAPSLVGRSIADLPHSINGDAHAK